MESVKLGPRGPVVSRIGLGCEPLGGYDWGEVDSKLTEAAVQRALEVGINLFDTADIYGPEISEIRLGRALGHRRKDVVIVTKGGVGWTLDPAGGRARTFIDLSAAHLHSALEGSLRRLGIDCVPVYLLHWPDTARPIGEALDFLQRQRQAGKILYFGLSNFSAAQAREALDLSEFDVLETQYSLLDRRPEQGLFDLAREKGLGVLAYGTLAQGLLTGKYNADTLFGEKDRRHRLRHFDAEEIRKRGSLIDALNRVGKAHGKSPAQIAMRWVLEQPGVSCAIVGAKNPEQVEENALATGWRLSEKEAKDISNVSNHSQGAR